MITPDNYATKPFEQTPGILPQDERQELYNAANTIHAYCEKSICHKGCLFADINKGCRLDGTPDSWEKFLDYKWTDADIMMAKALRGMGYTQIRSYLNAYDQRHVLVEKVVANRTEETTELPKRSFANAKLGATYALNNIIREGEDYGDGKD